jgi:two-component system, chemotaxis family, CheB/CheR fusion protein
MTRAFPTPNAIVQAAGTAPPFYIVGVGASAGGLEALEKFFDNMRPDSGMAFVVIQHLSPDFKSLMDELLRRHTALAIHRVEDGMVVEPNAIYLIPPKKDMIISGGRLLLTDKDPSQGFSLPIDTFFRSLAQDAGDRAIGIVLSGTGSDGSRGIRDIHDAGGLVLAQSDETAKFDGMPRSAMDTGVVDLELPPEEMPAALLRYVNHPQGDLIAETGHATGAVGSALEAVLRLLRQEYGIDFSYYKPSTVARRIERRLLLNQSLDLDEYANRLGQDAGELNALYKDLLIGVTKFFRDHEAFARLEREVLPQLLEQVSPDDELRIWVAGCGTGEEAYSIAILLDEQLPASRRRENIKIFATDVHRTSLEFASAGLYDEASLSEVTPTRLQRYFSRRGKAFQVSPELRRMIVFAPHNLIKDAPFTKLNLISCRNLLIYFQPIAQKKVLSLFHFALKTGGVLFLGPSESPGELSEEFDSLDYQWKLYRKRRDTRLPADVRLPLPSGYSGLRTPAARLGFPEVRAADASVIRVYDALLDAHMPPSLLINEQRQLVHAFGGAGQYLDVRDGRHSPDVLEMIHPDLRTPLAGALQRSAKLKAPVAYKDLRVTTPEGLQRLKVTVTPVHQKGFEASFLLISLQPLDGNGPLPTAEREIDFGEASREQLHSLEDELRYTKENLQATIEELETSNEELQATNEELVASNEELQSTNEELHSVNEELYTVNAEYQRKIAELTELTDDMDNLLFSTDVGVMFLDGELCIRKFTPKIGEFFDLLPQDLGRRVSTFAHNIAHDGLLDDVTRVLTTREVCEREVCDRHGKHFLLRILPYRGKAPADGAVVTIIDISLLKQAEAELQRMSKVFMDGADPIIVEDLQGRIVDLNAEAERAYGWQREELLGRNIDMLVPLDQRGLSAAIRQRCHSGENVRNVEVVRRTKSGETSPVLLTLSLLTDESGQPAAIATIAKDIRVQKASEREAREAVRRRDQFLAMLSHELRNPLAAVLNAAHVFSSAHADRARLDQACGVIQRQAGQMARLLDDLLDVSRVTQGKIVLRKDICELRSVVLHAVEEVRPLVTDRGHQLSVHAAEQPLYVAGDATRLLQILGNLLTNAAKYTPPGGQISLSVQPDGDAVEIRVRDTGEGIPQDMLEAVFDLFVQSHASLERSEGGMGVGLTLVRNLVELHGGSVRAYSEGPGCGSEFVVRLPLTDERPQAAASQETATVSATDPARLRVLLVEDNADSREMLKSWLELDGYHVESADSGARGLEKLLSNPPDVALVDIGLPEIDGYEVARRVRASAAACKVRLVAVTGYGRSEDHRAILEAGFDEHLVKPVDPRNLAQALNKPR